MAIPASCPTCQSPEIRSGPNPGDWTCLHCGHSWRVVDVKVTTRDETGAIELGEPELPGFDCLPYPIALTAWRMVEEIRAGDKLFNAVSRLKDCFEATIKYLGFALLTEYFSSPACTAERSESLAEKMVRPSLGDWVAIVQRMADRHRRKPGPSDNRLFRAGAKTWIAQIAADRSREALQRFRQVPQRYPGAWGYTAGCCVPHWPGSLVTTHSGVARCRRNPPGLVPGLGE